MGKGKGQNWRKDLHLFILLGFGRPTWGHQERTARPRGADRARRRATASVRDGRGQLARSRASPRHPTLTSHGLPAPADLLQVIIVIVNDVPKAVHRPLRFLQLREEDRLPTHQRGAAAPQRRAGRGGGSAPTWDSSSSSSSKVKARNLELCQYSSSSARALLICNGTTRPQRRSRPALPRQAQPLAAAHLPRSSPSPGSSTAAARHRRKGGRRAGHAGTGSPPAAFRPLPRRSRTASPGVHCAAPGARLRVPARTAWRRGVGAVVGSRAVTAGFGAAAGAASRAEGPGRSARRNGKAWAGERGSRRKGRCRKPGGGAGPAVLAVSTSGRSGGGGPDGQVGGGRPALDRGAAGGRHQRQQLALVSGRAGTAAGWEGRGGGGRGPARGVTTAAVLLGRSGTRPTGPRNG